MPKLTGQGTPMHPAVHKARRKAAQKAVGERFKKDENKAFIPPESLEFMANMGYKHPATRRTPPSGGSCANCRENRKGRCTLYDKPAGGKHTHCNWWKARKERKERA